MKLIFTGNEIESMVASIVNATDDAVGYGASGFSEALRIYYYDSVRSLNKFVGSAPRGNARKIHNGIIELMWAQVENIINGNGHRLEVQIDAEEARRGTWTFNKIVSLKSYDRVRDGYRYANLLSGSPAVRVGEEATAFVNATMPALDVQDVQTAEFYSNLKPEALTPLQLRFLRHLTTVESVLVNIGTRTNLGIAWGCERNEAFLELDTEARTIKRKDDYHGSVISIAQLPFNEVGLDKRYQDARETWRNSVLAGRRTLIEEKQQEAVRKEQIRKSSFSRYEKHRRDRDSVIRSEQYHIDTLPVQNRGTKASRRWGIEIETGAGRDLSGTPSGWESKGDGSLVSAYNSRYIDPTECEYSYDHEQPRTVMEYEREQYHPDKGWYTQTADEHNNGEPWEVPNEDYIDPRDCEYCGEVSNDWDDYDSDDCVELVSPILTSFHSNGLKQITDDLENAPVTDSAGIHVHVEANDLNVTQIRHLLLAYDHLEPLIEASYRREERGYCKRRSTKELLNIVHSVADNPTVEPRSMSMGDRYVTVNLMALAHHGTIEFRAMGPVYNYDTLVRWAMFCREMVNTVKNGATAKEWNRVNDWAGVEAMFAKYGVEYARATKLDTAPRVRTLAQV